MYLINYNIEIIFGWNDLNWCYMSNNTLTVCSFMMNEKDVVRDMLESVKSINPDEIVVVDEYSTDGTRDILNEYNVNIIDGKLENNYSKIRNLAISYSTKNWILFVDADETLEQSLCDILRTREFLIDCEQKGYDLVAFRRKNYIDNVFIKEKNFYPDFQNRLMRNNRKIVYTGYIHERPTGYVNRLMSNYHIIHRKSGERQTMQNIKYNQVHRQRGMLHLVNPKYP